jgi:hypothetical protein
LNNGWAHLMTPSTGTYDAVWSQSPAGTYASSTVSFRAASSSGGGTASACDLAAPFGVIDSNDVQAAINMTLGAASCTANVVGPGVCNAIVVQRVVNATPPPTGTGTCLTGSITLPHSVTLNWTASSSSNVTNYRVYRGATTGGPYTIVATLGPVTTYTDTNVQAGQVYYYVTTAIDSTGAESAYSNEASASVPTP